MTIRRLFVFTAAALALMLFTGGTNASAATITVCPSGCDYTSIQTAVTNATAGDTIDVGAGTYTEVNITINKNLTIQGAGAANTIVQADATEGAATNRVFYISSGTVTLKNMTIRHGVAPGSDTCSGGTYTECGGGIKNEGTALTVEGCIITQNWLGSTTDQGTGAGVFSAGDLTINNSTISDNISAAGDNQDDGTGVSHTSAAGSTSVVITNSIISGNTAGHYTGGLLLYPSASGETVTITNTTISGNTSGASGGGAAIYSTHAAVNISFSTITGNTSGASQAGVINGGGTMSFINTILSANTDGTNTINFSGTATSLGGNLMDDNNGASATSFPEPAAAGDPNANGDYVGGATHGTIDPLLGALADNGGPTLTHALQTGSPAIDMANGVNDAASNPVTTDQRGQARPSPTGGSADIGAYELNQGASDSSSTVFDSSSSTSGCFFDGTN